MLDAGEGSVWCARTLGHHAAVESEGISRLVTTRTALEGTLPSEASPTEKDRCRAIPLPCGAGTEPQPAPTLDHQARRPSSGGRGRAQL